MRLEELIGSHLVVGLPETRLTPEVAEHLRAIHASGFIAFERNFESPAQFRTLLAQLAAATHRPLLVMVDHEGGRVVRFSSGVTRFADPLTIGRTQQPDDAARQGAIEAKELRALGVQVNLAPCVDVLAAGSDPIIGARSYGSDPQRVAAFGAARIRGLQGTGVAACAKHFPGLGAVPKDPHKHLPTVSLDWHEMRSVHLVPFQAAIEAGVAMSMPSHVCYPRLDPTGVPATFSSRLLRGLLREELGFQGVVISDDLKMGALRELAPIGEAAVRALEAGHDLVLVCSDLPAQRAVFEAFCEAYRTGRLSIRELEHSGERLRRLRASVSS